MKQRVARTDEIPVGATKQVDFEGELVLLVNVDGEYLAISDRCSHADASLSQGTRDGHHITCPHHGAKFDLRTGEALTLPAVAPVESFAVLVENGELFLEEKE